MAIIELQGANHLNKGGQLMLIATSRHMAESFPKIDIGLSFRGSDWILRERDGFKHIIYFERERFKGMNAIIGSVLSIVPAGIRQRLNLEREADILAVLDASGFRYSDQWGPAMLESNADRAERLTQMGIPIVLLPQAFGPFKSDRAKSAAKRLIDSASLVFARDRISLDHVRSVAGDIPKIRMGPDFTNLIEPAGDLDIQVPERSLMVVPNTRMLDKMGTEVAEGYVPFLLDVCVHGANKGYNPVVLVHDAEEDIALGRRIVEEASVKVDLIFDEDPRRLKGYLSKATVVISSRFHALVGALSCGTPSIAVGWSHKYNELLDDYGLRHLSLSLGEKKVILETLDNWADDTLRDNVKNTIIERAKIQKDLAHDMWRAVDEIIAPVLQTVA